MARHILIALLLVPLAGCMEGDKKKDERLPRVPAKPSSLYERLGGEDGIKKVVDDFVVAVIDNDRIRDVHKTHFKQGDVAALKKKLVDQIGAATGGPQRYTGKNMKDAHMGMGITDADFNALVASLETALDKNKVGKKEQNELLDLLEPMRKDVIEK
jgi:hemoglobin